MVANRRVALWCFGILVTSCVGQDCGGSKLASSFASETQKAADLNPIGFQAIIGEKEAKEDPSGTVKVGSTPYVEPHCPTLLNSPTFQRDDLVLPSLQSSELRQTGEVCLMQTVLVQGVGTKSKTLSLQEHQAESPEDQSRADTTGRVAGLSQQGSLGTYNTKRTPSSHEEDGREGRCSRRVIQLCSTISSGIQSEWLDGRGKSDLVTPTGSPWFCNRTIGRAGVTDESFGAKRGHNTQRDYVIAWQTAQVASSSRSADSACPTHQEYGCRMANVCAGHSQEAHEPCGSLPEGQSRFVGTIQQESCGTSSPERGSCNNLQEDVGGGRCSSGIARGTGARREHGTNAGNVGGCVQSSRNLRWRDRGDGCPRRNDGRAQEVAEGWEGLTTLSSCGFTQQSCIEPSQGQAEAIVASSRDPSWTCLLPQESRNALNVRECFERKHSWLTTSLMRTEAKCEWEFEPHNQTGCDGSSAQKRVSFNELVEVCVAHDMEQTSCFVHEHIVHLWLRSFWHLHGQLACWQDILTAFDHFYAEMLWKCHEGEENDAKDVYKADIVHSARFSDTVHRSLANSDLAFSGEREGMRSCHDSANRQSESSCAQVQWVETWYLRPSSYELCVQSRRVRIEDTMTVQEVEESFRQAWNDIARDGEWSFFQVSPPVQSLARTSHHVLLVQNWQPTMTALLIRCEVLPPLRKLRAAIFALGTQVTNVFQVLQLNSMCRHQDYRCCLTYEADGQEHVLSDVDEVFAASGQSAHGSIRFIERASEDDMEEHDGNDSDDESDSDISTCAPTSSFPNSEDEETMSLMSMFSAPHSWQQVANGPLPWEMQPEQEEQHDEHLEEVEWEIDFAAGHETYVQNHLDALDGDATYWNVVSYGLGVISLGRRETRFNPNVRNSLLWALTGLWQDHAAHGDVRVHYVFPQPLEPVANALVVIVEILYGETHHWYEDWDHEKPVLVIEHGATDANFQRRTYATRLTNRVSAGCVTVQLGHHECFPTGIRDCHVQHRGEELTRYEYHPVNNGDLFALTIDAYPEHVTQANRYIVNAEDFFMSARSFFEDHHDEDQQILICAHGISPSNRPLGRRMHVVRFGTLHQLSWMQHVVALWPFSRQHFGSMVYVAGAAREPRNRDQLLELHFIVPYASWEERVPILVTQNVYAQGDDAEHSEQWAVMMPRACDQPTILGSLAFAPFWVVMDHQGQIMLGRRPLADPAPPFRPGDQCELDYRVWDRAGLLSFLLQAESQDDMHPVIEAVSFLQTHVLLKHDNNPHEVNSNNVPSSMPSLRANTDDVELLQLRALIEEICSPHWVGLNCDFQYLPPLHPAAVYALQHVPSTTQEGTYFHIYTDGSAHGGQAAWAFIVVVEVWNGGQVSFAKVGYAGDLLDSGRSWTAGDAESMAIIAMCEFVLSRPLHDALSIRCHYDAIGVGHGAMGMQKVPRSKSDLPMQARIMLSLVQRKFPDTKGHHVKAHSDHPWNEFADSVAVSIRKGWRCPILPQLKSEQLRTHVLREWAWMEVAPDKSLPDLATILRNDQCRTDAWRADPLFEGKRQTQAGGKESETKSVELKCATANVGTMNYEGQSDHCMSLKSSELLRQFDDACYDIIGVQESRSRHTQTVLDGPFARFISAGSKGQAGVELWIQIERLKSKFGMDLDPFKDIVIWHNDERSIATRMSVGTLALDVLVLYAPQQGRGIEEVERWWAKISQLMKSRDPAIPVVILGDLNAKIGSVVVDGIGALAPDFEDAGGTCLRNLLQDFDLAIPSTMEDFHPGQTWTFKGTVGQRTRVDYIVISMECLPSVVLSWVDSDLDMLNGDRDHCVVALQMTLTIKGTDQRLFERISKYDRKAACNHLLSSSQDTKFVIPDTDWNVGVHEHWANLRDHFQEKAVTCFPKMKRQQRQLYFSERAWSTVCQRRDVRNCLRHNNTAKSHVLLGLYFGVWKCKQEHNLEFYALQIHVLNMQEAIMYERQQQLDQQYRSCKKDDWRKWVEEKTLNQLAQANQARGADVFRIFQPKKLVRKHAGAHRRPLPGLQDAEGRWNFTRRSQGIAWQHQFSAIENAVEVQIEGLYARSIPTHVPRPVKFLTEIPSLFAFEAAVRSLDVNKATGADGVGAELLKLHAPVNTQKLFAMMLKMSIRGQSTPEATGGWLLPLHKKGSHRLMHNYRAIMLEPTLSRAMSRAWRPQLEQGVVNSCSPMQWGGRQGIGIEGVHLHVRLWQDNAAHKRESLGLAFIDIRSAFYAVIKPFLSVDGYTENDIAKIFRFVSLPHEAYKEFLEQIRTADLIRSATRSTAAAEMVSATLAHTWFCLPQGNALFAPQTGSRPGDPLADLMFAYIVSRMVDQVNFNLGDQHVVETQSGPLVLAPSVTWVDDMTFAIQSNADSLVAKTMMVMSEIISVFMLHGFQLSYGSGKTAIILDFKGKNATQCRIECESKFPHSLPIMSEYTGRIDVPLVSHYKHLGGFIVRGGTLRQEVQVRSQQAVARLKPLRHLLKNPRIPIDQRRIVLKSMVLSVLSLHSGTWAQINQQVFQIWKGALFKCYAWRSFPSHLRRGGHGSHMSHAHGAFASAKAPVAQTLLAGR